MAIVVASSSKAEYDGTPPAVCTAPSGIEEGDILIAIVASKENNETDLTAPAGFIVIEGVNSGGESMRAWYKIAVVADETEANYSFGSAGELVGAIMLRITGGVSVFTNKSSETSVNGVFPNMDLTPAFINSLFIFAVFEYTNSSTGDIGGYAIVEDNPSWTEQQELAKNIPFSLGGFGVATAIRAEKSASGNFSVSDTGAQIAIALVISPVVDVTVSPAVINLVGSVQAPAISGDANVSPAVIDLASAVQDPTVTIEASKVKNTDKSSESSITNTPKS